MEVKNYMTKALEETGAVHCSHFLETDIQQSEVQDMRLLPYAHMSDWVTADPLLGSTAH